MGGLFAFGADAVGREMPTRASSNRAVGAARSRPNRAAADGLYGWRSRPPRPIRCARLRMTPVIASDV